MECEVRLHGTAYLSVANASPIGEQGTETAGGLNADPITEQKASLNAPPFLTGFSQRQHAKPPEFPARERRASLYYFVFLQLRILFPLPDLWALPFPPFFAKAIRAPDPRARAERAQHARGELRALSCLSRPFFAGLENSPAPSPSRVASRSFLISRARPLSLVGFIFSTQAEREREREKLGEARSLEEGNFGSVKFFPKPRFPKLVRTPAPTI